MNDRSRLIPSSIGFAVFWTLFMWLWHRPDVPGTIILIIAGAITGLLWYFGMTWWFKRSGLHRLSS
jgi:hypothetical protein